MFVLSTWYVLRLPYRPTNAMDAPESPLEWGLKTLSRQNFFTDVGVGLDPTNNVLSLMAFLITWRVVGRAVAEDASCCSQEANLQGFDSFITEHIGNNSLRPAMEALCLYMRYHCEGCDHTVPYGTHKCRVVHSAFVFPQRHCCSIVSIFILRHPLVDTFSPLPSTSAFKTRASSIFLGVPYGMV